MRHRVLRGIGYVAVALFFAGAGVCVLLALFTGNPFMGINYYGLPIGTYSTAAVFLVGALGFVVWGYRLLHAAVMRWRYRAE